MGPCLGYVVLVCRGWGRCCRFAVVGPALGMLKASPSELSCTNNIRLNHLDHDTCLLMLSMMRSGRTSPCGLIPFIIDTISPCQVDSWKMSKYSNDIMPLRIDTQILFIESFSNISLLGYQSCNSQKDLFGITGSSSGCAVDKRQVHSYAILR